MFQPSREQILGTLSDDALVLDVGGWADPLGRADWVMDWMPYETRGLYERRGWRQAGAEEERFGPDTWVRRDLCDRDPFPFADDQFDFVVCAHTLEDLRDPVWVASELARVGKAGYVELPSRLQEQSWGVTGACVGWPHHHWLIEERDGALEFVLKQGDLQTRSEWAFPYGFFDRLDPAEHNLCFWWDGGFEARERYLFTEDDPDAYFADFVAAELARRPIPGRTWRQRVRRLRR